MLLKVIIVDPKYQLNVGYIARVSENFGVERLVFVKPRANILGKKAIMFSKHGVGLLRNANIVESLDRAVEDCDMVVGTSGIWRIGERLNEKEYLLEEAVKKIGSFKDKDRVIGLLIGRDDKGLNRDELEKCDMLVHIPANPEYPVLNISHALAIMLYSFRKERSENYGHIGAERPTAEEIKRLNIAFEEIIKKKRIRNRKAVRNIFAKMIRRARLNRSELHAVITAFK